MIHAHVVVGRNIRNVVGNFRRFNMESIYLDREKLLGTKEMIIELGVSL